MSDKPSLYVVEKKEVVILVVLFVLVTVLSFTMGVRYGESVGKKTAELHAEAEREAGASEAEVGGKLEASGKSEKAEPAHGDSHGEEHGSSPAAGHGAAAPGAEHSGHGAKDHEDPETAAGAVPAKEVADKNSDEFLLNALKDTAVEPPGGKAPMESKLPQEVKKSLSGTYVIQVGSHPTRSEADSHVRQLKEKNVKAEVLPPFKDKHGQWHRVIVGSYKTKREAEKEAARLKSKGAVLSYFVWRLP